MKLKDYILKNPSVMVKIGAGSGFFFMGRLHLVSTTEFMEQMDAEFKRRSDKRQRNRKKDMQNARTQLASLFKDENTKIEEVVLRNLCDQYVSASDNYVKEEIYQKKYKPLLEREVVEEYIKVETNENYIFHILIVEGDEQGDYWLWDEWKENHPED